MDIDALRNRGVTERYVMYGKRGRWCTKEQISPTASVDDGMLRNRGQVARGLGLQAGYLDEVSPGRMNNAIPPVALLHLSPPYK